MDDTDHLKTIVGSAFGLFSECQRINCLIEHHNLQKLLSPVKAEAMTKFINAVDARGKAHALKT